MNSARCDRLLAWIDRLDSARLVEDAVALGCSEAEARNLISTYAQESLVGLEVIEDVLASGPGRVLEVGSGAGFLVRFLRSEGIDAYGLEPAIDEGFSFMRAIDEAVGRHSDDGECVFPIDSAALDPARHGVFDFIYSINVIEHIEDLDGAFSHLASVLGPSGRMTHACPNYRIPYEPHLGLPLVPLWPRSTRWLFPRRIRAREPMWESLNFCTVDRVRGIAAKNELDVEFRPGTMTQTFRRLRSDQTFRDRHPRTLSALANSRMGSLIEATLGRIPRTWQSPMIADFAEKVSP